MFLRHTLSHEDLSKIHCIHCRENKAYKKEDLHSYFQDKVYKKSRCLAYKMSKKGRCLQCKMCLKQDSRPIHITLGKKHTVYETRCKQNKVSTVYRQHRVYKKPPYVQNTVLKGTMLWKTRSKAEGRESRWFGSSESVFSEIQYSTLT